MRIGIIQNEINRKIEQQQINASVTWSDRTVTERWKINLQELNDSEAEWISAHVLRRLKPLIVIVYDSPLTDEGLAEIAKARSTTNVVLVLADCPNITGRSIASLKRLGDLKGLRMYNID